MIYAVVTITAHPGKREAVLALFSQNRPAVLAEKGCIRYEAVIDVPNFGAFQTQLGDDTFCVIELWESEEALKAHAATAHVAEFGRATKPFLASLVINVLQAA